MASTTETNIADNIRFFGSLMGTPGISPANNDLCNEYINKELKALKPFVQDYVDEAREMIKLRKENMKRIEEEEENSEEKVEIITPTSNDFNNLKITR